MSQTTRNPALSREPKALLLAKHAVITSNETALVPSFTKDKLYHVNMKEGTCECPDFEHRGTYCMHRQAADLKQMSDRANNQDQESHVIAFLENKGGAIHPENCSCSTCYHEFLKESSNKKGISKNTEIKMCKVCNCKFTGPIGAGEMIYCSTQCRLRAERKAKKFQCKVHPEFETNDRMTFQKHIAEHGGKN